MAFAIVFVVFGCWRLVPHRLVHPPKAWAARVQIDNWLTALEAYRKDVGGFPTTDEGLQAWREDPGHAGWNGPYLPRDVLRDPWGVPYVYRHPGAHGKLPDIFSFGADRRPGGEGINADIVSGMNADKTKNS